MPTATAAPDSINQVKAFHAFCLLGGDCARVALLFNVEASVIEHLAHGFNWRAQITGLTRIDTVAGLTELQQLHRVGVFIVAERAKQIFVNIFDRLESDPKFAATMTTKLSQDGARLVFDAKALVDLVKGYQALTEITYRALGDKPGSASESEKDSTDTAAISISVYQALQKRFDRMPAVDTNTEVAKVLKEDALIDARPI